MTEPLSIHPIVRDWTERGDQMSDREQEMEKRDRKYKTGTARWLDEMQRRSKNVFPSERR